MSEPQRRRGFRRLVLVALLVLAGGLAFAWDRVRPPLEVALARAEAATAPLRAGIGPALAGLRDRFGGGTKAETKAPQREAPPVPVGAAAARRGDLPVVLTGLGTVQPYNTVLVRSRVDGQVMRIAFDEGQIVKKGDLLVEIDPRPYQAALDGAKAKRQQDMANLQNVQRDLNRSQSLVKNDYVTRQTLDTQTASVAQLTAQVAADDAAIENAQTQLGYATIRAPITGRVGFRLVDQGNIVNAGAATGIVTIAQIQPIAVVFTQSETELTEITAGQKTGPLAVTALSGDGARELAKGTLETFNNEIDTASGTIKLKAAFPNTDDRLWPGLSVSTRLAVRTIRDAVLIPASAVQHGPSGLYAFVIGADERVEARPIKVTLTGDQDAAIADGIAAGERVVTTGQYRLQPKTKVKVVPPQGAQTARAEG